MEAVRAIISEELDRYAIASSAVQAAPLISALRCISTAFVVMNSTVLLVDSVKRRNALDVVTTQLYEVAARAIGEVAIKLDRRVVNDFRQP